MLRRLRWQLTLLYLLAALGLTVLSGAGSYSLLRSTLNNTTDLAIQYKMAASFEAYGLDIPLQLAAARRAWAQTYAVGFPASPILTDQVARPVEDDHEGEEGGGDGEKSEEDHSNEPEERHEEELFDARLAALFVLPLGPDGELLHNPNAGQPPISPDQAAAASAALQGYDWRTIHLENGAHVRLLTYTTGSRTGPAFLQVGRLLNDQDRALSQFLSRLFLLGSASILVLGLLSWGLSGRSLGPAQKAWDQQQVFVANASHELRTPLTLVRASAEYGLMNDPGPEIQPLLEDIRSETDYMNRLVEDLLLLSRLDARRLTLERKPIVLDSLLREIFGQVEKLTAEREIHLVLGDAEGVIRGDPVRMRQVLLILLDNAMRFTPPGGSIRLESGLHKRQVIIQVTDNGGGIAPEHLAHIFERFYQAGGPAQEGGEAPNEARSNGLGLSIAKALVEAQAGSIHLESQVRKGTRVSLGFPASEQEEAKP